MQRKKRIPRTLGYVAVVSITMLFLFMMCTGQKNLSAGESMPIDSSLVVGWGEKYKLNFESIQTFLKNEEIVTITFVAKNGRIFYSDVKGIERPPCGKINGTSINPIDGYKPCTSLSRAKSVVGLGQKTTLYTTGSPYCVAETMGGYIIEYDPFTGGPCQ